MMADSYTIECLKLWSSWRARRDDGGTGFHTKCSFTPSTGDSFWTPELDSKCYEVDSAVCSLIAERKIALMAYYTQSGTNEQKAKLCGCCIRTYWTRVNLAQHDVQSYMNHQKYRRL